MGKSTVFDLWPSLKDVRVVVYDHDLDERVLLEVVLRQCHGDVTAAPPTASPEATGALGRAYADVAIVDIDGPPSGALALVTHVRTRAPAQGNPVATIALSAFAPHGRRSDFLAGFDAHLTRPIDLEALVRTVAALAARRAAPRAAA